MLTGTIEVALYVVIVYLPLCLLLVVPEGKCWLLKNLRTVAEYGLTVMVLVFNVQVFLKA